MGTVRDILPKGGPRTGNRMSYVEREHLLPLDNKGKTFSNSITDDLRRKWKR